MGASEKMEEGASVSEGFQSFDNLAAREMGDSEEMGGGGRNFRAKNGVSKRFCGFSELRKTGIL